MTGQQPIDVVLLDSDMPDMDGAQTARAIYERFPPDAHCHVHRLQS